MVMRQTSLYFFNILFNCCVFALMCFCDFFFFLNKIGFSPCIMLFSLLYPHHKTFSKKSASISVIFFFPCRDYFQFSHLSFGLSQLPTGVLFFLVHLLPQAIGHVD